MKCDECGERITDDDWSGGPVNVCDECQIRLANEQELIDGDWLECELHDLDAERREHFRESNDERA